MYKKMTLDQFRRVEHRIHDFKLEEGVIILYSLDEEIRIPCDTDWINHKETVIIE